MSDFEIDTYFTGPNGLPTIRKGPAEVLDYSWDFTKPLARISDTIAAVDAVDVATGLTKVGEPGHDATHVTQVLSGGAVDQLLRAECRITTAGGRTISRAIYIQIVPR